MIRIRAIVLVAIVLRLAACLIPAIWYDEAFSLSIAPMPVAQIIAFQATDLTPPLWEIVIHPFLMIWHSVIIMRLIACAFSLLSMWLAWHVMKLMKFEQIQMAYALLIIAVLPGIIWMSSDGRSYAMLTCFYLAGIWSVLKAKPRGLFIFSTLMLYTHVTGVFLIAGLFLFALRNGFKLWRLFWMGAGLLLAWSPWIVNILAIAKGDPRPFTHFTPGYFLGEFAMSFWVGASQWLWLAGLVLVAITVISNPKLYGMIFVPVLLIGLASSFYVNVITYRTLSPVLIPFAIWSGRVVPKRPVLAVCWMLALIWGVGSYDFHARGSDQIAAAQMIRSTPVRVVYATLTVALPFDYYLHGSDACILQLESDGAMVNPHHDWGVPRCTLDELRAPYWFVMPNDPLIPRAAFKQMQALTVDAVKAGELHYVHMAPVGIYWIR